MVLLQRFLGIVAITLISLILSPTSVQASTVVSLCNEMDETIYVAARREAGLLTGYTTTGWTRIPPRGVFRSCERWQVSSRWEMHFVVAVRRGDGFKRVLYDSGSIFRPVATSTFCVPFSTNDFRYSEHGRDSASCSAGFAMMSSSVNVRGGTNDVSLDLRGSVSPSASPDIGPNEVDKSEENPSDGVTLFEMIGKWDGIGKEEERFVSSWRRYFSDIQPNFHLCRDDGVVESYNYDERYDTVAILPNYELNAGDYLHFCRARNSSELTCWGMETLDGNRPTVNLYGPYLFYKSNGLAPFRSKLSEWRQFEYKDIFHCGK